MNPPDMKYKTATEIHGETKIKMSKLNAIWNKKIKQSLSRRIRVFILQNLKK